MYTCVYFCMYVHVCIYVYVCTCVYTCPCMSVEPWCTFLVILPLYRWMVNVLWLHIFAKKKRGKIPRPIRLLWAAIPAPKSQQVPQWLHGVAVIPSPLHHVLPHPVTLVNVNRPRILSVWFYFNKQNSICAGVRESFQWRLSQFGRSNFSRFQRIVRLIHPTEILFYKYSISNNRTLVIYRN